MTDVDAFRRDGYVRIDGAAVHEDALAAQALLWERIGLAPHHPRQWTRPVVWTADLAGAAPFGALTRHSALADTLDDLVGADRWIPRASLGNIVIRFPLEPDTDDRGWHIDHNTPLPDGSWAVSGRPHTVLLLTLLSEVGAPDAPTRIRVGSHHDAGGVLGTEPMDAVTAGERVAAASTSRPVAFATGHPGDMFVLHPLTVHAADRHHGRRPRFMAQAPVLLTEPLTWP
ncbi:MAG: phytanoyl-CoA dioxygenase family protein [Mycolicibacterium cosmeticum]|nr:phytanoyl-CoA dioxygenase family protein [Mycolicibacterium cosmeticum]